MLNLIRRIMRFIFYLLYHPFAFTYDWVAATVSLNRWKDWVFSILPFVEGTRVLELGHGPGHLQRLLRDRKLDTFGLDESAPMGKIAKKRLRLSGYENLNLTRGVSQHLPYPGSTFHTVISTFPSEYIFDQQTLAEVKRCLLNGGRLIVLPVAWHIGRKLFERFLAWVFRITGESPNLEEIIFDKMAIPFIEAGFQVEIRRVEVKSSLLLIVLARKNGT